MPSPSTAPSVAALPRPTAPPIAAITPHPVAAAPPARKAEITNKREFSDLERMHSGMVAAPLLPFQDPDRWEEWLEKIRLQDRGISEMTTTAFKGYEAPIRVIYATAHIPIYATTAPAPIFEQFAAGYRRDYFATGGPMMERVLKSSGGYLSEGIRQLAAAYRLRGYERESVEIYEQEIARCRKAGEPAQLARAMDGYGILSAAQGDLTRAEQQFREALAIRQNANLADEARSWMLLCAMRALGHQYATEEDPLEQAKARLAAGRINFAYVKNPEESEAEVRTRKANALAPVLELAFQLLAKGDYGAADRVMSIALVAEDAWRLQPSYGFAATCALAAGEYGKAFQLFLKQDDVVAELLRQNQWRSGYDQAGRMEARARASRGLMGNPSSPEAEVLADRIIARNGFAFHQALEKRRRLALPEIYPGANTIWQALIVCRTAQRDRNLVDHRHAMSAVQVSALEARLAEALGAPPPFLESTAKAIGAALPTGAAFVDYSVSERWLEKIHVAAEWTAVIVQPGRAPAFVRCGSVKSVRAQIARYRELANPPEGAKPDDAALESASRALYESIVAPVDRLLTPTTHTVFVCPDSALAFVGLGALLDESQRFWCERRDIRYVTSGRALLASAVEKALGKEQPIALLGDPQFATASGADMINPTDAMEDKLKADGGYFASLSPQARKESAKRESELIASVFKKAPKPAQKFSLAPLPGTSREVNRLRSFFETAGWRTATLLGSDATEVKLKTISRPGILHLATHGVFLDEIPSGLQDPFHSLGLATRQDQFAAQGDTNYGYMDLSPLMRSCLALAGAETTYTNWQNGSFPKTASDGMLMADEVMDMDLSRTLLVTLSACETGLGASVSGEGAVGVQRAFLLAGARHVLATLWPIADAETVEFMEAFYRRVLAGEKPPAALTAVQRELLVERRKKLGLAQAVYLTAPFVLTSAGQ